jgi:hypothetical protein
MSVTRLSGGLTPADGGDPRTFPAIWNATADLIETGFRLVGIRYFTSSGTFDKADPFGDGSFDGALMRAVRVRVQAGGGGAGGAAATTSTQYSAGGAGGGGAYAESFVLAAALGSSETVTVGAAGAGGAAGNNNGTAGGGSSFGTLVTASGGNFGNGRVAQTVPNGRSGVSGAVQTTATGDLTFAGQEGTPNVTLPHTLEFIIAPAGGMSRLGVGGAGRVRQTGTAGLDGNAGNGFGAGGSGGVNTDTQAVGRAGGAGVAGVVIVEVFA